MNFLMPEHDSFSYPESPVPTSLVAELLYAEDPDPMYLFKAFCLAYPLFPYSTL